MTERLNWIIQKRLSKVLNNYSNLISFLEYINPGKLIKDITGYLKIVFCEMPIVARKIDIRILALIDSHLGDMINQYTTEMLETENFTKRLHIHPTT